MLLKLGVMIEMLGCCPIDKRSFRRRAFLFPRNSGAGISWNIDAACDPSVERNTESNSAKKTGEISVKRSEKEKIKDDLHHEEGKQEDVDIAERRRSVFPVSIQDSAPGKQWS